MPVLFSLRREMGGRLSGRQVLSSPSSVSESHWLTSFVSGAGRRLDLADETRAVGRPGSMHTALSEHGYRDTRDDSLVDAKDAALESHESNRLWWKAEGR